MDALVARQAIFDRERRLFGYELLFRSNARPDAFDGTEAGLATKQVLANSLLVIGLENLVGANKAFVNFGRVQLLQGLYSSLPPANTVIELLETVKPDDEVIEACRLVRAAGYQLALDDFVLRPGSERLMDVADFVKIEIKSADQAGHKALVDLARKRGLKTLAEKVETQEEFEWTRSVGYEYFQGYFFAKPANVRGRHIPSSKLHCLQLLKEAQQPELDFDRLEELILKDVSLSYQLLRYVNSPLFALTSTIRSIRQALLYFGESELRKWITLATLTRAGDDKPNELIRHSLVRARFCELVAELASATLAETGFLTGLFSLLDALTDRPLEETLVELSLAPDIAAALAGKAAKNDPLAGILDLARAYESANWERVGEIGANIGIPIEGFGDAYCQAAGWAKQLLDPDDVAQPS